MNYVITNVLSITNKFKLILPLRKIKAPMENLNIQSQKIQKCPYQVMAYGENNCDVAYRTAYKGNWGHWDEPIEESLPATLPVTNTEDSEMVMN